MKIGAVVKTYDSIGIVMKTDGSDHALCYWADGRMEWIFLPNYSPERLKIITSDKKCP
jgi:hypothetical protein